MILISILGYILLVVGILLAAIIFIPYHYQAAGEKFDQSEIRGSVSWLFGGIKLIFSLGSKQGRELTLVLMGINKKINIQQGSKQKKDKEDSKADNDARKDKKRHDPRIFLKPEIRKKLIASFIKILKHCQPNTLSVHARIGFYDPMCTGFLCAINSQLYLWLNKFDICIQPVFDEEVLEGRFLIGGRIWLPYLILVLIGLLLTKPIRNILFTKKKRNNKGGTQYV